MSRTNINNYINCLCDTLKLYGGETPDEFINIDKAYGITVHKFQGFSINRVIIPIPDTTRQARHLIDRTLLYTAVTRAEEQAVFVGNYETFKNGIIKKSNVERRQVGPIFYR